MRTFRCAVVLAAILLLPCVAFAIPQLINYQGKLANSSGNPYNGDVNITFTVYNAPSAGDVLWTETQTVTVTDGVFNVLLGSQNTTIANAFDGDERYLGIKVDTDPEMTPRQRLVSVPYAMKATAADSVLPGGVTASSIGEDCALGETLIKGLSGWECGYPNYSYFNWAWINGSSSVDQSGAYGTMGVAAPSNVPGARNGGVSWMDSGGNMWLFGGYGYDASGSLGLLTDLWMYDGTNWAWVNGPSSVNQSGVYGTMGVAAPGNVPGLRRNSVSWTDTGGNLWLFGGWASISERLNDLWKYDGTNWAWINGSSSANQLGVYGNMGVAAPGNVPGARYRAVSWTDSGGNLWLFGGKGYDASGPEGSLNDLWKYDGTNWAWINGPSSKNQNGVYGNMGVAAPGNVPGARSGSVSWTDSGGNLWLFGGDGYDASGSSGSLNDLWKYDGTNWAWVGGSSSIDQSGVYGNIGVAAPGNVPGARSLAVSWTDSDGNLWLFGGYGHDASGSVDRLNDLWKYDGTNWAWVSGSSSIDQSGAYGTMGIAAPFNVPGARNSAVSWTDSDGNMWLFGGYGYDASGTFDRLNDLWKYTRP